jgi:tetratricopeptide (TPR) repeat protein
MIMKSPYLKYLLAIGLILVSAQLWPQQPTDSILKLATQQIYENPDQAIELAHQVLEKTRAKPEKKVSAILIISTAYSSKRDYEKSLEYTLNALELLPKLKDNNLKINLLNRIGGQYQELKIYDKAISYLDQAKILIENSPKNDATIRSLAYNNLVRGFIYREQMSCDIALNYFEKAIEGYRIIKDHPAMKANISTSYYNRGNCLIALGKLKEAENSFLQSVAFAQKIDAKSLVAFAQKGLAEVYTAQGHYQKAISLLMNALQNSENVGDKVLNRALYNALATNYLATGNLDEYSFYKNKNLEVHSALTKAERQTVDNSIYDLIKINTLKIETIQKRTKIFQVVFVILILLALIFMGRFIFRARKNLKLLERRLNF